MEPPPPKKNSRLVKANYKTKVSKFRWENSSDDTKLPYSWIISGKKKKKKGGGEEREREREGKILIVLQNIQNYSW